MDPSSPLQLIAWAVAAVLALLTAGCVITNPYQPATYYAPPVYGALPAQPALPAYAMPRPSTTTCFGGGGMVTCM